MTANMIQRAFLSFRPTGCAGRIQPVAELQFGRSPREAEHGALVGPNEHRAMMIDRVRVENVVTSSS